MDKNRQTKMDYVRGAALALCDARGLLADASADLGTPEEIKRARLLADVAVDELARLIDRLTREGGG